MQDESCSYEEVFQNTTTSMFAFWKQGPVICILKGTKHGQGKQCPSGMYWLLKINKKLWYKNRLRNKILKYHWLWSHSSGSPSWWPFHTHAALTIPGSCIYLCKGRSLPPIDGQYLLLLVVTLWGHTRKQRSFISVGIWENLTAYCSMEPS